MKVPLREKGTARCRRRPEVTHVTLQRQTKEVLLEEAEERGPYLV